MIYRIDARLNFLPHRRTISRGSVSIVSYRIMTKLDNKMQRWPIIIGAHQRQRQRRSSQPAWADQNPAVVRGLDDSRIWCSLYICCRSLGWVHLDESTRTEWLRGAASILMMALRYSWSNRCRSDGSLRAHCATISTRCSALSFQGMTANWW